MTEFGYLSVLLSIIFGLAIAHLLQGWRGAILYRTRVREYWPTHVWAAFLLLVNAQAWWAMFDLRDRHDWTFTDFVSLLAEAVTVYLASGLVFPDFSAGETTDLRTHYFTNHRYFFGALAAILATSIGRTVVIGHSLPDGPNLGFHIFYLVSAISGAITAHEKYHKFMTVLIAGTFLIYVAWLFARLH